jgi:hypothetical protein
MCLLGMGGSCLLGLVLLLRCLLLLVKLLLLILVNSVWKLVSDIVERCHEWLDILLLSELLLLLLSLLLLLLLL